MTSPWRYADFRWLTLGVTVNGFGSSIAPVALAFAIGHMDDAHEAGLPLKSA